MKNISIHGNTEKAVILNKHTYSCIALHQRLCIGTPVTVQTLFAQGPGQNIVVYFCLRRFYLCGHSGNHNPVNEYPYFLKARLYPRIEIFE